ncbi:MAG: hypothetical protein WDN28_04600 [Chthoniobacter sp.]
MILLFAGALLLFCAPRSEAQTSPARPVRIFFDTDMETDCDDAGALAVLHALADRGECEILATVVSVRDPNSAATVDAINRYYGRPNLPLGMVKGGGRAGEIQIRRAHRRGLSVSREIRRRCPRRHAHLS